MSKISKKLSNQFICSRMMLPEHRAKLNEYRRTLELKETYPQPPFDDQQWEEFQLLVIGSLEHGCQISVTFLTTIGYDQVTGVIKRADPVSRQIHLITKSRLVKIDVSKIVRVEEIK